MPIAWTESLTLRLVTFYSKHECLRNPLHPHFKDKLCRYRAYKEIADSMNIGGLTVCDCIKRIIYVKSQYCSELSKIGAAISCEKFYRPTASWFPIIHQLFFPFIAHYDCPNEYCEECNDKSDTLRDYNKTRDQLTRPEFAIKSVEPDIVNQKCNCPYAICHCNEPYTTRPRSRPKASNDQPLKFSHSTTIHKKYFMLRRPGKLFHSTQIEGKEVTTPQSKGTQCTNYPYLRLQKVAKIDVGNNTRKYINTENATQTDVSYFKTASNTCQVYLGEEIPLNLKSPCFTEDVKGEGKNDEFDMFGKSIAFQLRNIRFEMAIKLEKRIQDLIAQERLESIKSKCSDCCTTSSCSECKVLEKEMVCSCGLPVITIKGDPSCDFDCKQRI